MSTSTQQNGASFPCARGIPHAKNAHTAVHFAEKTNLENETHPALEGLGQGAAVDKNATRHALERHPLRQDVQEARLSAPGGTHLDDRKPRHNKSVNPSCLSVSVTLNKASQNAFQIVWKPISTELTAQC